MRELGAFPFWLLYLTIVWKAICCGFLWGQEVAIDSTLLSAWTGQDPDAAWFYPSTLCWTASPTYPCSSWPRQPSPTNDLPFAYPLLWFARFVFALAHFIVTMIKAHPIIPFNHKKQLLAQVRHLSGGP